MPDLWLKYQRKYFRIEAEIAGIFGTIKNRALTAADNDIPFHNQSLSVAQFGGAIQGEYRFLEGALRVQLELGFASGDPAPGFGNFPNRPVLNGYTRPGDIDGPRYNCPLTGPCIKSSIRNFRFARDYRIDSILFRELLGGITDAIYAKPTLSYQITEGLMVFGSTIGSRAVYRESTPSSTGPGTGDPYLGIEFNLGARYETSDGFFAQAVWGLLIPLGGLANNPPQPQNNSLDSAQIIRGLIGVKF
jgi:uncharacterized protein (TIGR04551 family)